MFLHFKVWGMAHTYCKAAPYSWISVIWYISRAQHCLSQMCMCVYWLNPFSLSYMIYKRSKHIKAVLETQGWEAGSGGIKKKILPYPLSLFCSFSPIQLLFKAVTSILSLHFNSVTLWHYQEGSLADIVSLKSNKKVAEHWNYYKISCYLIFLSFLEIDDFCDCVRVIVFQINTIFIALFCKKLNWKI